ncbi:hypothetical protein ACRDNQ_16745 [Palleronia sp. KMU-117]|uniref:hypothetical protein n=1 Tax=Palleronia sp. KMU-117 TaxID=3434108 RepID=UPI003D70D096
MHRTVPFALALLAAPFAAQSDTAADAAGATEVAAPGTECQSCTARHRSLQTLQRARADRVCPDGATAPCTPEASGQPDLDDDAVLRLPDGQLVGGRD